MPPQAQDSPPTRDQLKTGTPPALTPVQSLLGDSDFQTLSPEGKRKALRRIDSDFGSLSDDGVDKFITRMGTEKAAPPKAPPPKDEDGSIARAWKWITTPPQIIEKGLLEPARKETERHKQLTEKAIAEASPTRAYVGALVSGVEQNIDEIAQGALSKASLALSALSVGEAAWQALTGASKLPTVAKVATGAVHAGAGAVFGGQGALSALTPQQEGETLSDYLQRVGMSTGQALLAGAGSYASFKDSTRTFLRNRLRLNDNLAQEVSERVARAARARGVEQQKIESARTGLSEKQRAIESQKAQRVVGAEQALENSLKALEGQVGERTSNVERRISQETADVRSKLTELDDRKLAVGSQTVVDTTRVLAEKEAYFKQEFDKIGDKIPSPVAHSDEIKEIIAAQIKAYGAQEGEIPRSAYAAFPEERGEFVDTEEGAEPIVRPGQEEAEGLSFNDLTRIKNDLYAAARRHTDGAVKGALHSASEIVSNIQEDVAGKAGLGEAYGKLKGQYMRFARGIGSDQVYDWIWAENMSDQQMAGKIAKLISRTPEEARFSRAPDRALALKAMLKSAGIDTSAFDQIIEEARGATETGKKLPTERREGLRATKEGVPGAVAREKAAAAEETTRAGREATQATTAARRGASEEMKAARTERTAAVAETEAPGKIIPGMKTSELAGMSQEDLLRERVARSMGGARALSIPNLAHLLLGAYGLFDLAMGKWWGLFPATYGLSRAMVPELVRNRTFQDWLIRKSGVEPSNKLLVSKLRHGIEGLYPFLRRAAQSQAPAAALSGASMPPTRESLQQGKERVTEAKDWLLGPTPPTREDLQEQEEDLQP